MNSAYGSPFQKILNQSWPLQNERGGGTARDIPLLPTFFPVDARVVWEHDGEEVIKGEAQSWIDAYAYVAFMDARWCNYGVWLHASDVTRLGPPS